jgi:hypothetical protein
MIHQVPAIARSWKFRSDRPAFLLNKPCRTSATTHCGYRWLKISLAIYLIPALLVVLIVGAIGAFVVGVARFLSLFFDLRSNRSGTLPDA